eukprot:s583_g7.t1
MFPEMFQVIRSLPSSPRFQLPVAQLLLYAFEFLDCAGIAHPSQVRHGGLAVSAPYPRMKNYSFLIYLMILWSVCGRRRARRKVGKTGRCVRTKLQRQMHRRTRFESCESGSNHKKMIGTKLLDLACYLPQPLRLRLATRD